MSSIQPQEICVAHGSLRQKRTERWRVTSFARSTPSFHPSSPLVSSSSSFTSPVGRCIAARGVKAAKHGEGGSSEGSRGVPLDVPSQSPMSTYVPCLYRRRIPRLLSRQYTVHALVSRGASCEHAHARAGLCSYFCRACSRAPVSECDWPPCPSRYGVWRRSAVGA